jgi:hypothetical protein
MPLTHWSSAVALTSMTEARPSMIGANSVLAIYSTCTSHEKRAELCAGNVLGPKLSRISFVGMVRRTSLTEFRNLGSCAHMTQGMLVLRGSLPTVWRACFLSYQLLPSTSRTTALGIQLQAQRYRIRSSPHLCP